RRQAPVMTLTNPGPAGLRVQARHAGGGVPARARRRPKSRGGGSGARPRAGGPGGGGRKGGAGGGGGRAGEGEGSRPRGGAGAGGGGGDGDEGRLQHVAEDRHAGRQDRQRHGPAAGAPSPREGADHGEQVGREDQVGAVLDDQGGGAGRGGLGAERGQGRDA